MKMLAVVTGNFAFYHDAVARLKRLGVSFVSLGLEDEMPVVVGAVVTTRAEAVRVDFSDIFTVDYTDQTEGSIGEARRGADLDIALDRAAAHLRGKGKIELLVVGVDPGKRPGIAAMGDATELKKVQADRPEDVGAHVRRIVETYRPAQTVVRLGDGAPTQRDRVINSIADAAEGSGFSIRLELVDERNTSDTPHHSDTEAAIKIALTPGREVSGWREVSPSEGELRELQRRSRLMSGGEVTISRELAMEVALGAMDIGRAIDEQRRRRG